MSQAGTIQTGSGPTGTLRTLTGNTGGPVPPTGFNINVVGDGTTITVAGNPGTSTLTISALGNIADSFPADSGTAVPVGGVLNIFSGGQGRATPDVITSASGNTVSIDLRNSITLGDLVAIPGSPALLASSGNIITTNGDVRVGSTANSTAANVLRFDKSRSGGVITSGDSLGAVWYLGFDGTNYQVGAQILSTSNGTIAAGRIPANLDFGTKSDSASPITSRMVISSEGNVTIKLPTSGLALNVVGGGVTAVGTITFPTVYTTTPGTAPLPVVIDSTGKLAVGTGSIASWIEVTTTSATMAADTGYIANNAGLVTLTLPATCVQGTEFRVTGKGAGGWKIAQNAGQTIYMGNLTTTGGVGGSLASTLQRDTVELVCITANTEFNVLSSIGNITVV